MICPGFGGVRETRPGSPTLTALPGPSPGTRRARPPRAPSSSERDDARGAAVAQQQTFGVPASHPCFDLVPAPAPDDGKGAFHSCGAGCKLAIARLRPSHRADCVAMVCDVDGPFGLIEFPADEPHRARRFWSGLLGIELAERSQAEGRGWQTHSGGTPVLAFTNVAPARATRPRCRTSPSPIWRPRSSRSGARGSAIHPGAQWAICRDSEGSPFGLALASRS